MPQLPDHYVNQIFYGDSLDILKQLPDEAVDLIVTDPPYGEGGVYGAEKTRIVGDEHPLLALSVISEAYRVLKRNSPAYMFFGIRHLGLIQTFLARYTRY